MARKPTRTKPVARSTVKPEPSRPLSVSSDEPKTAIVAADESSPTKFRARIATILAVCGLLSLHYAVAANSLVQENPTVDEVAHMPAGITYWQKHTFRLYHHNPPLVKLVAALPVVLAKPEMDFVYQQKSWTQADPSQATFSQTFAFVNKDRYFELFRLARLMMPLFSIVGGLTVFGWSRRLYGTWGGLLSLSLWVFCPNVLAHARLVTSDVGSAAMGVAATYAFWRYMHRPGWRWAAVAGALLGLAQLTKFTMLLLYAVWPFLWLVRLVLAVPRENWGRHVPRALGHGVAIIVLSILTIDAGYFFEGVGIPLGSKKLEFGSRLLTRPVAPGTFRPSSKNLLFAATWQFRENRFRGTWMRNIPCPLPEHYLTGFDEQKIETEGLPERFVRALGVPDPAAREKVIDHERRDPESPADSTGAYAVYLNGELRRTGWWYYYPLTLVYKLPEGTWLLVILSLASLRLVRRSSSEWADETSLATVPLVIVFSMSFLTDINLGLRYVLAILPYVFIATGKLVPWTLTLSGTRKRVTTILIAGSLGATIASAAWIHPHYLAYFNWASGGPDRVPARLIDSNLDWGQDLVALQKWWKEEIPGKPIGLAYFGQINPSIFALRGESFDWFLPPVRPESIRPLAASPSPLLVGPAKALTPGYYAISATLLHGLPWRLYDPAPPLVVPEAWSPAWNVWEEDAFWYFRRFQPIKRIGHSIYVYHLSEEDVAGSAPLFMARDKAAAR